jgi:hypothetical protein
MQTFLLTLSGNKCCRFLVSLWNENNTNIFNSKDYA